MSRFFKGLNPLSRESGIRYSYLAPDYSDQPMIDYTFDKLLSSAWQATWRGGDDSLSFLKGICVTFEILAGNHYDVFAQGHSYKGLLDLFILPLLARKLIANNFPPTEEEQINKHFLQKNAEWGMAVSIALPIEIVRCAIAVALTIALLPVVTLVHVVKNIRDLIQSEPVDNPLPAFRR